MVLSPTLLISIGTRRHVNDLAGQDQGDNGKEANMVVHDITIRGEGVLQVKKFLTP